MTPEFTYRAKLVRVVDGDTFDMDVDLGFRVHVHARVRLLDVNCPESKGKTHALGIAAAGESERWFKNHHSLVLRTHKPPDKGTDSFGRWLAEVYGDDLDGRQESLAQHLLATHHAVPYERR